MLKKAFRYLTPIALSYWIGSMMFFSFVFAPRVFKILERSQAAELQNAIFYPYYASLAVCAVIIMIACLELGRLMKFGIGISFLNLCLFLLGYFYLTPTIHTLFAEGASETEHFKLLHQASVFMSAFAWLSGLFLLFTYFKSVKNEEL